jgi:hypothetical protein
MRGNVSRGNSLRLSIIISTVLNYHEKKTSRQLKSLRFEWIPDENGNLRGKSREISECMNSCLRQRRSLSVLHLSARFGRVQFPKTILALITTTMIVHQLAPDVSEKSTE